MTSHLSENVISGMMGIVDYTNYEDMQYAVSITSIPISVTLFAS